MTDKKHPWRCGSAVPQKQGYKPKRYNDKVEHVAPNTNTHGKRESRTHNYKTPLKFD